jgi:acyl-CoA thioester hydrolase
MTPDLPILTPLPVETLRAQGVPAPIAFGHADRVRFAELDPLDHVNNARFLAWFETLRIAYLRAYGLADYADRAGRPRLVLRRVTVDYRAPLHLDETYVAAGRTRAWRRTSFTMEYGVWAGGTLRATSEAVICLLEDDLVTGRPLPDAWTRAFADRDGAAPEG